jgi:hypothetical protein
MRSLVATFLFLLAATIGGAAERPQHYESPYTDLGYDYELFNGAVSSFRIWTGYGKLAGTMERMDRLTAVSLSLIPAADPIHLRVAETIDAEVLNIVVLYGNTGEVHYSYDADRDEIEILGSVLPDPQQTTTSPVFLAVRQAADEILNDLESFVQASVDPPVHEVEIASVLVLSTTIPGISEDLAGRATLRTSGCAETGDHESCDNCCDLSSHLATICRGVTIATPMCTGNPACRYAAPFACNAAGALEVAFCQTHNCTGLPGDPACTSPPTCAAAGGLCKVTCGAGWSSACGLCPEGKRCCSP